MIGGWDYICDKDHHCREPSPRPAAKAPILEEDERLQSSEGRKDPLDSVVRWDTLGT